MKPSISILLFLFLTFLNCKPISAQFTNTEIDSLKSLIFTNSEDSTKARLYSLLSWHYARTRAQTDIARFYADSSMALATKLGDERRIALAHYDYGTIDRYEGNYNEALKHLDKHISFFSQEGDSSMVADGLFHVAVVHRLKGDYEESLATYYRILNMNQASDDEHATASVLHNLGLVYRQLKDYPKAEENYLKALSLFEKLDEKKDIAMCLNSLGSLYGSNQDYEKARLYFLRAIEINRELGNIREAAFQIANLGHIATYLNNHEEALAYHLEALEIRQNLPQKIELLSSLRNVGNTYTSLENYSEAHHYLLQALSLAQTLQAKPHLRDIYEMLASLNEKERNYSEALGYHKLFAATKDSILNEESSKQINELQAKYETAVKNEEIATLTKENELNEMEAERRATLNWILGGGLILISIISGLVVFILRQRFKNQQMVALKNEELKTATFKQQLSELEMKALRAQMNPHFMFNCMNSINRMILSSDNENASRYLTKFSKLIRLMLQNSEQPTVPLEDELSMLETYIQLENMRFNGKINYHISIDDSIDQKNTLVPSMVLQPFIENAIWHGLLHKDEEGLINITIRENDDELLCVIEDNGIGREKALELKEKTVSDHKSMGLQITEERLRLLNRKELKQLIKITDLKDSINRAAGTRVDINIPIT